MTLVIHLLGRPRAERPEGDTYQPRRRKSWAVLAYLVLNGRPPSRGQLASLLFAEADDPLRALRWSLAEIRRLLGDDGSLGGDPVRLVLSGDVVVDVAVIGQGVWTRAADLPGLGEDLLEGVAVRGAAGFDAWLLSERRRLAAASEAVLHEARAGLDVARSAGDRLRRSRRRHEPARRQPSSDERARVEARMRELVVRSMLHAAALGSRDDGAAAALLGAEIDSPVLEALLHDAAAAPAAPTGP